MKRFACVLALGCLGACVRAPLASVQAVPAAAPIADDALALRLDAWAEALAAEGFFKGTFEARGFLPPTARATYAVRIPKGRCGLFVALASPNVSDLDAALYSPDGDALAEDEGSDSRPAIVACAADRDVDAYFSIHAYQGGGAFVTRVFERASRAGDDLATVRAGEPPSELADLAKLLRKRGFEDEEPRVELSLHDEQPVRVGLHVLAGYCYTAAAQGSDGLEALSLRLLDGAGAELAHGVGDPGVASLQYCSSATSDLALEVAATRGLGTARLARFQAPQAVIGGVHALWLGEPTPTPGAFAASAKTREELASKVGGEPIVFEQHALSQGRVFVHESRAPLGACETWHLELAPGLARASLRIEGAAGRVLGSAEANVTGAHVTFCRNEPTRVVVTARAGFGGFTLAGAAAKPEAARKSR